MENMTHIWLWNVLWILSGKLDIKVKSPKTRRSKNGSHTFQVLVVDPWCCGPALCFRHADSALLPLLLFLWEVFKLLLFLIPVLSEPNPQMIIIRTGSDRLPGRSSSPPRAAAGSGGPAWPSSPPTPGRARRRRSRRSARRWPAAAAWWRPWPAAAPRPPSAPCTAGWGTCSAGTRPTVRDPAASCRGQQIPRDWWDKSYQADTVLMYAVKLIHTIK